MDFHPTKKPPLGGLVGDIGRRLCLGNKKAARGGKGRTQEMTQKTTAINDDREKCINLAEQARDLIDELHTERLNYGEYNLLRDAVDCMQAYIEDGKLTPYNGERQE